MSLSSTLSLSRNIPEAITGGLAIGNNIAINKLREDMLIKGNRRYQQLFDSNIIGIMVASTAGNILEANDAFLEIVGYTQADLLLGNMRWDNMTAPEYRSLDDQALKQLHLSGTCSPYEKEFVQKDGNRSPVFIGATFLEEAQGSCLCYVLDLKARKQMENSLRESQLFLEEAQAIGHMGSWSSGLTADSEIILSKETHRLLGVLESSTINKLADFWQLIHPRDINFVKEAYQTTIVSGKGFSLTFRIIRPDGIVRWIYTDGNIIKDSQGVPVRVLGVCQDITDSKQTQEKLYEQAALLDIALDAIYVIDLDNNILYWNKGAEEIYGYTSEEVIGKPVEFIYKKNLTELAEASKSLDKQGHWMGEMHHFTKKGEAIIVESRWTLMKDSEGNSKAKLTVNTNVTEKRLLEAKFLRVQRMESLGTLAGGIAHDLNNMLSPITIGLTLLGKQLTDERAQRILAMMESSVRRGADLVSQVLLFSRGTEGKRTVLKLNSIIDELEKMVRQTFPKTISIRSVLAQDLWPLVGDATQIYQVLMNLCVNARDAMLDGGEIAVDVNNVVIDNHYAHMHLDALPGHFVCITVADTGMGMSQELITKIFEPFFTTKEAGKGTGLGLSTSIAIAKSHGGFISVYSELNKGTAFKVYLSATTTAQTLPVELISPPQLTGHGELILVVDDESSIREITKLTLESYGYQVMMASDGTEAIASYAKNLEDIHLVLIDIMMPNLDGYSTIKILQKIDPKVKIISTSGFMTNNKLELDSNIKAFLTKPYTANKLLETITEVLKSA